MTGPTLWFDAAYQNYRRYKGNYQSPVVRSITAGQVFRLPEQKDKANVDSSLTSSQRSLSIGDPVPIVFARRVAGNGGIFISPGATEARFATTVEYNVVIQGIQYSIDFVLNTSYHLVLSEGIIDSIPVKDVFQGTRRTGSHTQTYSRRAGTWIPGNFVATSPYASKPTPECSQICGSVGLYPNISTLSFSVSTRYDRTDSWKYQVHVFIRGGMYVNRLFDGVFGPSNNFADLVKWVMQNVKRIPDAAIDNTSMLSVAQFLEVNQFTCNAYLSTAIEYEKLAVEWAPYFLTQFIRNKGKEGLRSLLPVNTNGTINTGPIQEVYTFDESLIVPGSLNINYTPLEERLPFVAQMIWRQQPDSDVGITRTLEVNYRNLALDGPYEKHDLSAFCTNENHAAKVGTYIVSTRANVTHTISFDALPGAHNSLLKGGDIIRVVLDRSSPGSVEAKFVYLYRIVQIVKDVGGGVSYDCVHFPVDSQGRSIVAMDVNSAVGTGYIMSSRSGITNDDSPDRKNNTTIPTESYTVPGNSGDPSTWGTPNYQWYNNGVPIPNEYDSTYTPTESDIGDTITVEVGYPNGDTATSGPIVIGPDDVGSPISPDDGAPNGTGSAVDGGSGITVGGNVTGETGGAVTGASYRGSSASNPSSSIDGQGASTGPAIQGTPASGNTLTYEPGCPDAYIEWRLIDNATDEITVVSAGVAATYVVDSGAGGKTVVAVGRCPDPSAPAQDGVPAGYGPPIFSPPVTILQPCRANPANQFTGITGTISTTGTNTFTWTSIEYSYKITEPSNGSCPNPELRPMNYNTGPGGSATITGGCSGLILQTRPNSSTPYGPAGGGACGGLSGGFPGGIRWAVQKFNGDFEGIASQGGGNIDIFTWQLIGLTVTSTEPNAIDAADYFGNCS